MSLIRHAFVKRLNFQFLLRCKIKMSKRGRKTSAIVAPKNQSICLTVTKMSVNVRFFLSLKFILWTVSRIKDVMKHQ